MASQSSMLVSVRTFLLVGVVTLLVWLLAESESLRADKVQVRVVFKTGQDANRLVRLEPGQDFTGTVSLRLEGPTSRVDTLSAALKREIILEPGNEAIPSEPGRHTVSLPAALRAYPLIRDSGVTIVDADPPTAVIVVDNLETRDAKIRVELPDGQLLEAAPEVFPPTAKVSVPEAMSKSLPADFQVVALLDAASLANLPEGRRSTVSAPLDVPEPLRGVPGVRVAPVSANVSLTLRSRTATATLATVPVHLRLAPTEIGLWDIQIPESSRQLTDVTVSGPSDTIAQIKAGTLKPIAFVPLSFEELERAATAGQPLDKEPIFCDLPTALRFDSRQKTVRLIIKRREGTSPSTVSPSGKPPS